MYRCAQTVVPSHDGEDGGGSHRFLHDRASRCLGPLDSHHVLHTSMHSVWEVPSHKLEVRNLFSRPVAGIGGL